MWIVLKSGALLNSDHIAAITVEERRNEGSYVVFSVVHHHKDYEKTASLCEEKYPTSQHASKRLDQLRGLLLPDTSRGETG
jgi:hypothetical protein